MSPEAVVYTWVGLGVLTRVLIPYLLKLKEGELPTWEPKYFVPPLMSIIISLVTLPLILNQMPADVTSPFTAFAFGWASTDIVRLAQKTFMDKP